MMTRKKRRMMIIISVVLLVLIVAIALFLLYVNTDLFQSNATLFTKYIGKSVEKVEALYENAKETKYDEWIQENKCTTQTEVKVNYTENIGTSSESTKNSINHLKLEMNGQTDLGHGYQYQDIQLKNKEEKVFEAEYVQKENTYGIKFSDLFHQYILVENQNLKELLKKMGYSEEQVSNLPDRIEWSNEWKAIFTLSKQERQNRKEKYSNIISSHLTKDNFSKEKNQTIVINDKNINTNAYVLTLTKEQLNVIYIKMLEEIKQDEVILNRMNQIEDLIKKNSSIESIPITEQFTNKIQEVITEITNNNIGNEECKIIVYENKQDTVRISVQHPDYEVILDSLSDETQDYLQISYESIASEKKQILTYKKGNEETNLVLQDTKDGKSTQYSLMIGTKIEGNEAMKNVVVKYEDRTNRVEAIVEQKANQVDHFENEIVFDDQNAIQLNQLEEEKLQEVLNKINRSVTEQFDQIMTNVIQIEDMKDILKAIEVIEEQHRIEVTGISETEKSRFNSQFEMLQGDNLDSTMVLNLIDAIQNYFIDIEVVSNTQLKLKLDRKNKNEQIATTLRSFMEENKDEKYNAKVEYDSNTGLVSDIVLTMLAK